jgi:hypothetical protein
MLEYDLGLNQFDFGSISGTKFFVLGIGGGNDVVGAYAVARLLKKEHSDSEILYGSCFSSNKKNYIGFVQIFEGLYIRESKNYELNENHSLRLVQTLKEFDGDLCIPYVIIADDKRKTGRITKETINYFRDYTIITIDNGGDSLTGGKDGKCGFDHRNLLCLKEMAIPFHHIILGLGCDGESDTKSIQTMLSYQKQSVLGEFSMNEVADIFSPMLNSISHPERENTDTTVIIVEVKDFIEKNPMAKQLYLVPRHERRTKVPYTWINKAVVFDGKKLVL